MKPVLNKGGFCCMVRKKARYLGISEVITYNKMRKIEKDI